MHHQPHPPHDRGDQFTVPPPHDFLTPQEKRDASMAHYLGLITWIIPLVMRANAGKSSKFVHAHATAATNLYFSMMIYSLGLLSLSCGVGLPISISTDNPALFGVIMLFVVLVCAGLSIWTVVAAIRGGNHAKAGASPPTKGLLRLFK